LFLRCSGAKASKKEKVLTLDETRKTWIRSWQFGGQPVAKPFLVSLKAVAEKEKKRGEIEETKTKRR